MNYRKLFIVKPGSEVHLAKIDPAGTDRPASREAAVPAIREQVERV